MPTCKVRDLPPAPGEPTFCITTTPSNAYNCSQEELERRRSNQGDGWRRCAGVTLGERPRQPGKTGYYDRKSQKGGWKDRMDNFSEIKVFPPSPGVCRWCATKHDPKEPHNRDSLYYQNRFRKKYKRFPTWDDAMAHCDDDTKTKWRKLLADRGIIAEDSG